MIEMSKITHWVVRADENFRGHCETFLLPDGRPAYNDAKSFEDYAAAKPYPVKVITSSELEALEKTYTASQITLPVEETKAQFWDALECLPPCRWRTVRGVELFHISERISHDLVNWHARIGERYFTFVDRDCIDHEVLATKVGLAASFAPA